MKQCPHCGAGNDDYASYCLKCGQSLANAGEYHPSAVEAKVVDSTTSGSELPPSNPAILWLILNIVGVFFFACTCFPSIIHIVGIVFASLAMGNYNSQNTASCLNNTKVAKILFIVGAVIGALSYILNIILGLVPLLLIPFQLDSFYY